MAGYTYLFQNEWSNATDIATDDDNVLYNMSVPEQILQVHWRTSWRISNDDVICKD